MSPTLNINQIIQTGILKSYWIDSNFIEVYWSHPSLEINNYYLFKFTTLKQDFISVKQITAVQVPRRYKMKKMQPMVNDIMTKFTGVSTQEAMDLDLSGSEYWGLYDDVSEVVDNYIENNWDDIKQGVYDKYGVATVDDVVVKLHY